MRLRILKILLWLVCITHVVLGLSGIFSPPMAVQVAKGFYGAQVEATPAIIHILRILGAYMFVVGILAGAAARDPERHRSVILAVVILLVIRVLQRLLHANEIQNTFGISEFRIWFQGVYFFVLAGVLFYLMPKRNAGA